MRVFCDALKCCFELKALVLCLLPLNFHYVGDGLPHIECFDILPELSSFDLGIIEKVLDHEAHEVGRGVLHIKAIMQLKQDAVTLRGVDFIL